MFASTAYRSGILALVLGCVAACQDPLEPAEEAFVDEIEEEVEEETPKEEPRADTIPVLASIPQSEAPAQRPDSTKVTCFQGPETFEKAPCPVVRWNGITYWPYSYRDNRWSFAVVGYDSSGEIVGMIEARGARYVWAITIDEARRTIEIFGQDNRSVTVAWDDLPGASR